LHGKKNRETDTGSTKDDNGFDKPKAEQSQNFIQSYSNPDKMCCYLCSRQFKSTAEVNKHERLSDLHKTNLSNETLKTQALAKMKKAGLSTTSQGMEEDTPEYRDRARERRAAFGSSKKVALPMKKQVSTQDNKTSDSAQTTGPSKSKGAALLGKMGWSTGAGLGAQGTGITAPIQTEIYAAGVGLGAEGGKLGDAAEEADRNTRGGYAEFVERAKDKAKERYQSMQ
jgi:hypothetical protein